MSAAATDHQIAVQFAESMAPNDLVIADEPEVFINRGRTAMSSLFAVDRPEQIPRQFGRFRSIYGEFTGGPVRIFELVQKNWK